MSTNFSNSSQDNKLNSGTAQNAESTQQMNDRLWSELVPQGTSSDSPNSPNGPDSSNTSEQKPQEFKNIYEPPPVPVDAVLEIKIDPEKMNAYVVLTKEKNGGKPIAKEMILSTLEANKVRYGIKEAEIARIIEHPRYSEYLQVAHGTKPEDGIDGVCTNQVSLGRKNKPLQRADGSMDFWELDLVQNIKKDTVICTITAETVGAEGRNICDEPVQQRKGKPAVVPNGKNTVLNLAHTELLATCDGNLTQLNGKFNVEQIFEVKGDVDISTGNLNFLGDIVISGDVREGFSVHAKGNVTVKGMIEGAEIVSGGDVVVVGGMNGSNKGIITCKGNLKCKYLENVTIKSRGNITSEYIANSNVMCDGEIELTGNRALLIGGNYIVLKKITTKTIGSNSHVPTNITLGAYGTILEEKRTLDESLEKNEKDTGKVMQIISFLNEKKQQLGKLPDDKESLLNDAIRTKTKYIMERSKLMRQLDALLSQLEYEGTHSLSCSKIMYPGTKITIKRSTFIADREYAFCTIYYDEDKGEIVVAPMR